MMTHRQLQMIATVLDVSTLNLFRWSHSASNQWLSALGAITGASGYYINGFANVIAGVGKGNVYWNMCSSMLSCLTGVVFWKETFSLRALTGIALGGIGIYLLDSDINDAEKERQLSMVSRR